MNNLMLHLNQKNIVAFFLLQKIGLIFFCGLFFFHVNAQSQNFYQYKFHHRSKTIINSFEIGLLAAETHYFGDLASYLPSPNILHVGGGLFLRYQYNAYWAFRVGANHGNISGNDAYLYKTYFPDRNLNFSSNIDEIHLLTEFSPTGFSACRNFSKSIYYFAGIAIFHFNPYTYYNGQQIYLQPLATEGQGSSA